MIVMFGKFSFRKSVSYIIFLGKVGVILIFCEVIEKIEFDLDNIFVVKIKVSFIRILLKVKFK